MEKKQSLPTYLLAASLFSVAISIVYFTVEISSLPKNSANALDKLERVSTKVKPIIDEVAEFRSQIPAILKEIEGVRKQVPSIVDEVKEVRKIAPSLITEIGEVRKTIPSIVAEVKEVRKTIPDILSEVKTTREATFVILNRADKVVQDAKGISKSASHDAVTGVITGIITSPFTIVGGIGKSFFVDSYEDSKKITESDNQLILNVVNHLAISRKDGDIKGWNNPETGNSGLVFSKGKKIIDSKELLIFDFVITLKNGKVIKQEAKLFLNDNSQWEIVK